MQSNTNQSQSGHSLKRPYGQQAHAHRNAPPMSRQSSSASSSIQPTNPEPPAPSTSGLYPDPPAGPRSHPDARADSRNHRPKKAPRVEGGQSSSAFVAVKGYPSSRRGGFGPPKPMRGSPLSGKGKAPVKRQVPGHPPLPEPLHDLSHIKAAYMTRPLKPEWEANPKSPLSNYFLIIHGGQPVYENAQYIGPSGLIFRTTVTIKAENEQEPDIVAFGDDAARKESEKLAALCALYQLDSRGQLDFSKKKAAKAVNTETHAPQQVTLSDGSTLGFERAVQFMDYYCRRFGFAKPEITYQDAQNKSTTWTASMTVDGRKIGLGSGTSKKAATTSCYVDVVQYLESCDGDLWQDFVKDSRSGKDLGLAKAALLMVDDYVADKVYDLCKTIGDSQLYRNRPRFRNLSGNGKHDADDMEPRRAQPKYVPPRRRQADANSLITISKRLQEGRKRYQSDPNMAKMRKARATLPVYTKSKELLKHIQDNEVTICLADTGSGKTTQIPQLILDDWIERGEGARCNIMCTQPRRIAAISVANRVAAERGERLGESIGYQVRFEKRLPADHGSVTFCTTGIFLKQMHSALQEGGSGDKSMDHVTHLIVDEVHERDVDTDLLLVVLKRLLVDRRARKIPLKIILMSATIDPTLFQDYFVDEQGRRAGIVTIPGRTFPVQRNLMDDFLPELSRSTDNRSRWVFHEEAVQKFIAQELGPAMAEIKSLPPPRFPAHVGPSGEDADTPHSLIALTIAYAIGKTDEGHVLVFLPGMDDIIGVQKCLLDRERQLPVNFSSDRYSIHILHSSIPLADQQIIFDPPPEGQRRVILATNIAETSITIPDVVCVVDTVKAKEQRYDPDLRMSALVSSWVGSSNLNQRAGRAGRHRPGEYFGLIGKEHAARLNPSQTVEMKRIDLSNIVMHVKALDFPRMTIEEVLAGTIEPPAAERVLAAIRTLEMVGALDKDQQLTPLGRVLLQLPVDTQIGKFVLLGSFYRCLDQALTLAAIFTNRDPFVSPLHLRAEANARKYSFCPDGYRSDAFTILRAYNEWWDMQSKGDYSTANRFCVDNFLSKPTLLMIQKIKGHILQSLYDVGVIQASAGGSVTSDRRSGRRGELVVPSVLDSNGDSLPLLSALIASALQPKFAVRNGERTYRTSTDKTVLVHPSSVNARKRIIPDNEADHTMEKQLLAYAEKRQNIISEGQSQKFIVNTTRVDLFAYVLFGAYRVEVTQRGLECDEWLPIIGSFAVLDELERLKVMLDSCMLRVYQGVIQTGNKRDVRPRRNGKEDESEDEDEDVANAPLSSVEIQELDWIMQDVVRILNDHSAYRLANQSQQNSRPGTPMDSPSWGQRLLPSMGGTRSGYSTPRVPAGIAFLSRPSTPSRLSRALPRS